MTIEKRLIFTRIFIILIYLIGMIGLLYPETQNLFRNLIPINLLITAVILFSFHEEWNLKTIAVFVSIIILTIAIEIIGVNTSYLFGYYSYGTILGPKIWNTPYIIGLNWLILLYCVNSFVNQFEFKNLAKALTGAIILVVFDFPLEQVAISLDMWDWSSINIPMKNYISWFLVSFVILAGMNFLKIQSKNKIAYFLFVIQLLFFFFLSILL